MSDNIKVVVKVRPLISREIEDKLSYQWRIKNNTLYQLDQNGKDLGQGYTFDKVYDQDTKTSNVYNDIAKPIVEAAVAGFNGTIFAYGQTSSGKTYTMSGTDSSPGIIPLAVLNLFELIKSIPDRDFLVRISFIEIYNDTVRDLLNMENDNIKIQDTLQGIVKVHATERVTSSPEEVLEAMKEGEANRQTGATNMNEWSSRSHSIFQIIIESREHMEGESEGGCVNVSQLNLVDLAGSERAGQTGATGKRFKEGTHINKSLSSLALVIKQLYEDHKFVNYRDSKLTRILQNSLGGNAKTSIICAVTPVAVEETISTLQFACRAKAIKNKPEVNAVVTNDAMIQVLTKQMCKLQSQLESKKNLEQDNYNLQNKINALQRLILNGFSQRSSIDMRQGARRKLQQPRRVTIHSTVSELDSESMVAAPKFCTPSLKYNPTLLQNTSDFVPIQPSSKLESVPEEPARLVTPPPRRTVNFSDEVINLDSDDDVPHEDHETCSPIHKCYGSSKTPPCILRKNCKIAEKNLKDIVELTEREKIFSPSVVELIEKLEENSSLIAKLQDELELLNKKSKEKDLENEILKTKLEKKETELKVLSGAKDVLQTECDSYMTKLTDMEVIYETLKHKARLREEELLSLLEEIKVKQPQEIGKISRHYEKDMEVIDVSKDLSASNSENENSIIPEDTTDDINDLITNTQIQLTTKNQSIVELEANLFAQSQKIVMLESLTQELEQTVSTLNEKLVNVETENSLLKSSLETFQTTIRNQEENLKSAHSDIESYNRVIQELKIKLTQRANFANIDIDDSVLENMITNEEHFIANNENMMNIIQSFKIAIDIRNKEIAELKNKDNNIATENKTLLNEVQSKTAQISILNSTIDDLKRQVDENVSSIRKYKVVEQEIISKLKDTETKVKELEVINNENSHRLQNLSDENNTLKLACTHTNLNDQISELTSKINHLSEMCAEKDDAIISLNNDIYKSKEILCKANVTVLKSLSALGTLTHDMQEVPEVMDTFVNIFSILNNSLNMLEIVTCNIITEKEELNQIIDKLKADLEQLQSKHISEVSLLQNKIDHLNVIGERYQRENDLLKSKLNEAIEIRDLELSIQTTKQEKYLAEKENTVKTLTSSVKNMENRLSEKISEINYLETQLYKASEDKHNLLTILYKEITDIANSFNIMHHHSLVDIVDTDTIYEDILVILKKIANHTTFINLKNVDIDDKASNITLTANDINNSDIIPQSTSDLTENESNIETQNKNYNNKQSEELLVSQQLLQDLQKELTYKASQLDFMEIKVREWKQQFESLDTAMKQKLEDLKIENENLKTRIEDLERESQFSEDAYSNYKTFQDEKEDTCNTDRLYNIIIQDEVKSPPSLLTICCNKIVESMEPKERESKSTINQDYDIETNLMENSHCNCYQLQIELNDTKEENSRLLEDLAQMEIINQQLIEEQNVIRSEIHLLLEPAQELQKKITNHRTNLSILTATTYAENKSLKSQVKVLQHHHKRFHNVCQRDIPDVKKQLSSLMTLLKADPLFSELQNLNFKRHYSLPDVLDSSTAAPSNFKNESTLDGDLLMLETNVTITTAADNTLTGHDQTCLDMTQFFSEASCQTNDFHQVTDQAIPQVDICTCHHEVLHKLNLLTEENTRLRELVDKYSKIKVINTAPNSPGKNSNFYEIVQPLYNTEENCASCKQLPIIKELHDKLNEKLKQLCEDFLECKSTKDDLEVKYNNLILERSTVEAKLKKMSIFEKEYNSQKEEITKLNNTISIKTKELKCLQKENDALSNQVFDNVSEVDDLTKVVHDLKKHSNELEIKCNKYEQSALTFEKGDLPCSQCIIKDKLIQAMQSKEMRMHAKLNRSLSDSDTSSRINKICTLQSELHAGREDCKELTEDVVSIKNHLERSNMSMDLDESLCDNSVFCASAKDHEIASSQPNKRNMPKISEEQYTDFYIMDKIDCVNYFVEKTGVNEKSLSKDTRIIEIMKMLYENLAMKHGQEVENLANKLKDYDEFKTRLQSQCDDLTEKFTQVTNELGDNDKKYSKLNNSLSQLRTNINIIHNELISTEDVNVSKIINLFRENLTSLDREFGVSSVAILDCILEILIKNDEELSHQVEKYNNLQKHIETLNTELNDLNSKLLCAKTELSSKENECDLLKLQKQRVHEISSAVTLDIIKREKELKDTIDKRYQTLIESGIVKPENITSNLPLCTNINILFDLLATETKRSHQDIEREKSTLLLKINNLTIKMEEKEKEMEQLKLRGEKLQEVNNAVALDRTNTQKELEKLKKMYEDLDKAYRSKLQENQLNLLTIEKNTAEINSLKASIVDKDNTIGTLQTEMKTQNSANVTKIADLLETVTGLQNEVMNLKRLNEMINKEKEIYAEELQKSAEVIQKNNMDIDKMTTDILVLRESVRENGLVIENLNTEAKSLLKQNMELKEQLEKKIKECSRLETNIKTHEKTAQIQTRMIMRIEKQKSEDDKKLEELSQNYTALQKEREITKAEIEQITSDKEALQMRITELESSLEVYKNRPSIDAISDSSRRRRQSLHDSKRVFADDKNETGEDHNVEAVFSSRSKPDDLFMDIDDEGSVRSSPIRLSKGRESLSLSRTDQSEKDEEHPSRPSSVVERRRRRQTLYDTQRSDLSQTPPPSGGDNTSSMSQLREELSCCQQELEELKEKYRQLDEECETCSEYLKERDEQCSRLKKEKISLQHTITELRGKLQSVPDVSQVKASQAKVADASVNTDEDWANLHSVVVDRMSYDAEVEKNKKLIKTVEELRFKKQDLKNTLTKMQKALERNMGNKELEASKSELQACKQELSELKERYKELDEECETCAQYLRDKEEQCRRLKEAKTQLEAKLQELHTEINPITHTARKKRQTAHDQNRSAAVDVTDAATETSDDLLSYQVERDGNVHAPMDEKHAKEVKHLKLAVERLSQQKSLLEQQLVSVSSAVQPLPMFVATGSAIVQNQQITDVMKENQKLKKINAKLINICKKRGKESNRENEDPADQG